METPENDSLKIEFIKKITNSYGEKLAVYVDKFNKTFYVKHSDNFGRFSVVSLGPIDSRLRSDSLVLDGSEARKVQEIILKWKENN